jgi:ATP-dependent DNA helicase RecQ
VSITLQDLQHTAASTFGWDDLRSGQEHAMEAVLEDHSILCVMPTGSGKSAIYQVPAMALPGVAVVISPLIALQHDQAEAINAHAGSPRARVINSALRKRELEAAWEAAADDDEQTRAKFLFLAPEQVARDEVAARLRSLDVSLVVVDEAHCVSSWGHDFRPDYLQLGHLVRDLGAPVVALTATASRPVQKEIVERLHLKDPTILVEGFDRPNLHLEVVHHVEDAEKLDAVRSQVLGLTGPGLVYVATKKAADRLAAELQERGRNSDAYHAGRRKKDRESVHEGFLDGRIDVVVATTAFGMGIDKPDVRFVVHADISDSLDSYYQEIGRGGRDGLDARAILHYRPEDLSLRRFFAAKTANRTQLEDLFRLISSQGGPVKMKRLKELTGLSSRKLAGLLNLLTASGCVSDGVKGYRARKMNAGEAVDRAVEQAANRERIDRSRIDMARRYAETKGCRRQFLLSYFGEEFPKTCGACDNCERTAGSGTSDTTQEMSTNGTAAGSADGSAEETAHDDDMPFAVDAAVEHVEWGRGSVMGYEDGIVTVLFETVGYKTLSLALVEEKDLLTGVTAAG